MCPAGSPGATIVLSVAFMGDAVGRMGRKGGGFGTTLVLALVIVVLAVGIGWGLSGYGYRLPVVGWFFNVPVQTTTSPVVVQGI